MYHRVVDNLKMFLESDDRTATAGLAQDASDYADTCRKANDRLTRCNDYLQRGLRAEAIHLAEAEPKLLVLVSALDFPHRREFDEIAAIYELPRPPGLLLDVAYALNEAYFLQAPLESLLDRHRKLALMKAPLDARLGVLRKLAEADAGEGHWDEDIRLFERAWFKQSLVEAQSAARDWRTSWLAEKLDQLRRGGFREAPPRRLVDDFQILLDRAVHSELQSVGQLLGVAHAARDMDGVRRERDRWLNLASLAPAAVDSHTHSVAKAPLAWLEDAENQARWERDRHKASDALARALNDPAIALKELEQLHDAALRFGAALPSKLDETVTHRLGGLREDQRRRAALKRRRAVLKSVAVAAVDLALLGALLWLVIHSRHLQRVSILAAEIRQHLSNNNLAAARQAYASADAAIATDATIVGVRWRLENLEGKERDRKADFNAALKAINAVPPNESAAPAELIKAARAKAKLADEQAALDDLLKQRDSAWSTFQATRERQLQEEITSLASGLDRIENAMRASNAASVPRTEVEALQRKLGELATASAPFAAAAMRVASLQQRASALDRLLVSRARERQLFADLLTCKPDIEGFAPFSRKLTEVAETVIDEPRRDQLRAVLQEQPLWNSIAEWNAMAAAATVSAGALSAQAATDRTAQYGALLQPPYAFPDADLLRRHLAFLAAVQKRQAVLKSLDSLFDDFLVANLFKIRTRSGKTYYTRTKPEFATGGNLANETVEYFVDFDKRSKRKLLYGSDVEQVGTAPQTVFAKAARAELAKLLPGNWDSTFANIVDRLKRDSDIDSVLRAVLIKRMLEAAGQGSAAWAQAMVDLRSMQALAALDLNCRWMDPDEDETVAETRKNADLAVARVTSGRDLLKAAEMRQRAHDDAMRQRWRMVGWLAKDEQSRWQVQKFSDSQIAPRADGDLVTAMRGDATSSRWAIIGQCRRGGFSVASSSACAEGRPVFVRVAGSAKTATKAQD